MITIVEYTGERVPVQPAAFIPTVTPFERLIQVASTQRRPPVALWHPEHEGEIDIRIARDGRWFHEGALIKRQPLVDLFATILRREDDAFFLVTPAEKLRIVVEDAPFVAVDFEFDTTTGDQNVVFETNVGDVVLLDDEHPLRVAHTDNGPRPYLVVRDQLEAIVARAAYYRLAELAVEHEGGWSVRSAGAHHSLG